MTLSAHIPHLKRRARLLARAAGIPLHAALDRIARDEGFARWSLLATKAPDHAGPDAAELYRGLVPGDLLLLGARPRQGKTLMALRLAIEAIRAGRQAVFFTLEYTETDVVGRLRAIGVDPVEWQARLGFDSSDAISAAWIIGRLADAAPGTLVVIDYLQLLDQQREKPPLGEQVEALKRFAAERGLVLVFLSQIDRAYEMSDRPFPQLADVRLPNPLDLSLFSKACFLNRGAMRLDTA